MIRTKQEVRLNVYIEGLCVFSVLFMVPEYDEAIGLYSEALQVYPEDCGNERAVCYANRAACYVKMVSYKT